MSRKKIRQQTLLKLILKKGFILPLSQLVETLKVSPRTIQRDLNEISDLLPKVALDEMKDSVILRLRSRVPQMKDSDLIRLVEFFVPKKRDVKVKGETQVTVKMWNWKVENE